MHVGNTKKDYKYFIEEIEHMQKTYNYYGYKYFDEGAIRNEINSSLYFSGMLTEDSYHLNPLKLLNGLAKQILIKGVKIYENTPVTNILKKYNPSKIVHLGSENPSYTNKKTKNFFYKKNYESTKNLVDCINFFNPQIHFIFANSSNIFL